MPHKLTVRFVEGGVDVTHTGLVTALFPLRPPGCDGWRRIAALFINPMGIRIEQELNSDESEPVGYDEGNG